MRFFGVILFFIALSACKAQSKDSIATSYASTIDTASVVQYYKSWGLDLDPTTNLALYNEVYKWMGTPYCYGGDTRKGLDCSGFSNKIYTSVYDRELKGGSRDIYKEVKPIRSRNLQEGDLLFFKIRKGQISHVGIYLKDGKFAHASKSNGVIISDLSEDYYKRHFFKAGRF